MKFSRNGIIIPVYLFGFVKQNPIKSITSEPAVALSIWSTLKITQENVYFTIENRCTFRAEHFIGT